MKTVAALLAFAAVAAATSAPGWTRTGLTPATTELNFGVALPMSNLDKLDRIFWDVSTPGSPRYGQFASMKELNALTATEKPVVERVAKFLAAAGATCKFPTGDSMFCRAAAGDISKMLQAEIHEFSHEKNGAKVHRVHGGYTFPAEMSEDILFFTNLAHLPTERYGRMHAGENAADTTSTLVVVPETLDNMYKLNNAKGSSSVIQAAAEFQGLGAYTNTDLSTFNTNTAEDVVVSKHIGPFDQLFPQAESTLDVQYIGAVGKGNTNWYWTEQQWMYDFSTNVLSGANPVPDVISMSYGWSETEQCQINPTAQPCVSGGSSAFVAAVNANFQKIGAAGHTLLAASGDSGAHGRTDGFCSSGKVHPAFPAASPYLTAVGATQLNTATSNSPSEPICKNGLSCATGGDEIVCSTKTGALITSGGGFSEYSARPSYQDTVVSAYLKNSSALPPASDFNAAGRGFPDVAALGHNYYIQLQGQHAMVDGTSCACPVFAGVVALLNAYRVENGKSKIGFANPLLYSMSASNPAAFNDITQGNNKCTEQECCQTGFSATTGWDATTGLGTPNFEEMIKAMAAMDSLNAPSASLLAQAKSLRGSF